MRQPLELIREIEAEKRERHTVPDYVLYAELRTKIEAELKADINELVKAGMVSYGRTVNSVYLQSK